MKLNGEFVIVITGRTDDVQTAENIRDRIGPMLVKLMTGTEMPETVWGGSGISVTQAPPPRKRLPRPNLPR